MRIKTLNEWQEANYPLRMSEKARVMAMEEGEFERELDRLAVEHREEKANELLE